MIHLTRINHAPLVLNSDLIEHIDSSPDTIITLTNAQKFVVLETVEDVVRKVIQFRHAIHPVIFTDDFPQAESHG